MKFFNSSKPKKIHTEEELQSLSKNDTYKRKKWVADAVTIVFIALIFVIGLFVVGWLVADASFRDGVKDALMQNLVGIVISGFVIIGFTFDRR